MIDGSRMAVDGSRCLIDGMVDDNYSSNLRVEATLQGKFGWGVSHLSISGGLAVSRSFSFEL